MRFAQLDPSTERVVNLIEAKQGFVDGTPDPSIYIPLDDTSEKHGIPVQFGDECTDRKARLFIRPPPDPTELAAAKLDASKDLDVLTATLSGVTGGSIKTAIQSATTLEEITLLKMQLASAIQETGS